VLCIIETILAQGGHGSFKAFDLIQLMLAWTLDCRNNY